MMFDSQQKLLSQYGESVVECGDSIDDIEKRFVDNLKSIEKLKVVDSQYHNVMNRNLDQDSLKTQIQHLEKAVESDVNVRLSKNRAYVQFKEAIHEIINPDTQMPHLDDDSDDSDEGDDIVVSNLKPSLKCPITQMKLVDPVRNQQCGHIFSKAAIEQYINSRSHSNNSCPISGCNARITTLIPDDATIARLNRLNNRIFT